MEVGLTIAEDAVTLRDIKWVRAAILDPQNQELVNLTFYNTSGVVRTKK